MFRTMLMSLKKLSTSQVEPPNNACGWPHEVGSGCLFVISDGIAVRGKCQILMAASVHSSA